MQISANLRLRVTVSQNDQGDGLHVNPECLTSCFAKSHDLSCTSHGRGGHLHALRMHGKQILLQSWCQPLQAATSHLPAHDAAQMAALHTASCCPRLLQALLAEHLDHPDLQIWG